MELKLPEVVNSFYAIVVRSQSSFQHQIVPQVKRLKKVSTETNSYCKWVVWFCFNIIVNDIPEKKKVPLVSIIGCATSQYFD